MLDHIAISVPPSRLEEIAEWYAAALAPLGYKKQMEFPGRAIGFGPEKRTVPFWIGAKEEEQIAATHVAFRATDRTTVESFYEEAVKAGGKCNGKPGWRHQYHPKYYAGFVLDPVGNNVEVVDHGVPH